MLAFIFLLIIIFISRILSEKAYKKLEPTKKVELMELFSGNSTLVFGILIILLMLYFISLYFKLIDPVISFLIYTITIVVLVLLAGMNSYKKLKANNFPASYIQTFLLASALRLIGLVVFFAIMHY